MGLWDKTKAYLKTVSMSCLPPGIYSLGYALSIDTHIDKHFLVFRSLIWFYIISLSSLAIKTGKQSRCAQERQRT